MGITHICQYGDCPYYIIFMVIILKIPRIRDLREDKDLKQKDLAAYLAIDQSTYSDYENGRINIYDANNNLLCSIIGKVIEPMNITDNTYYLIQNEDKVTIIRINEK